MARQDNVQASGKGGELHQQVGDKRTPGGKAETISRLTTSQGIPVSDNQNQLKAGARGPVLLEDFVLREKIFHFDHERIPERIVHARGSAAHGYFELYESLSDLTSADLFQRAGEKTPLFTRFSTVAGGAGSVDTPRDVRGFAVKFYTKEGNWDLVGNNIPVFFIQDAIKFPDLIHSVKMEADRGFPQAASAHDTFWDFISLMPEATHMIMWAMSDRAIPRSLRTMEGFGIHTFRLVNAEGKVTLVKFHWKPKQGLASTSWDEAVKLAGADPDFQRRDLFEAISRGDHPEWELGIQAFDEELADSLPYDVLDPTKIIPEEIVPVRVIGRMVLDRNPDNFFAETEQVAYCPANIVPGIDFTNDPLLQGRLFSYLDTQLKRLGSPNFTQISINAPKCPMMNFQRDAQMQMQQFSGRANYEPNSLAEAGEEGGPRECPHTGFRSVAGRAARQEQGDKLRLRPESFADHYSQARLFFRSLDTAEQAHLASAVVFELSKVGLTHVRTRILANLVNVDGELARRVAQGLGMEVPDASPAAAPVQDLGTSPAVRIIGGPRERDSLKGGTFGVLVADGSPAGEVKAVLKAIKDKGGTPFIVSPKVGEVTFAGGSTMAADGQLAGSPSVLFDAVAIILSPEGCKMLMGEGAAVQFAMDAFAHCKAIAVNEGARPLLEKAGVMPDEAVVPPEKFGSVAGRRHWAREPKVRMLA
ncbi:catalase [Radicibacter daui]|uniref:catalase n=1 Tax=Radicibacter daui TaxID=3064829 RepID=UPI004046B42B